MESRNIAKARNAAKARSSTTRNGNVLQDTTRNTRQGEAINQYADWEDTKRGFISRREFVKLHVIVDARGRKIVSCAVTIGRTHDSPVFRRMFGSVPDGTGCVMLDAGYDAVKNYKMIRDAGRRPSSASARTTSHGDSVRGQR